MGPSVRPRLLSHSNEWAYDFTLPKTYMREWHWGGDRGHFDPSVVQSHSGTAIITSSPRAPGIQQKGLGVSLVGKDAHWKSLPCIPNEIRAVLFFSIGISFGNLSKD